MKYFTRLKKHNPESCLRVHVVWETGEPQGHWDIYIESLILDDGAVGKRTLEKKYPGIEDLGFYDATPDEYLELLQKYSPDESTPVRFQNDYEKSLHPARGRE